MNTLQATLHRNFTHWLVLLAGNALAYTSLIWIYRTLYASLQGTYTFEHSWFTAKLTLAVGIGVVLVAAVGYLTYGLVAARSAAIECLAYYRFRWQGGNAQFFLKYRENPSWYYHLAFRPNPPSRASSLPSIPIRPKKRNIDRPFARVFESC